MYPAIAGLSNWSLSVADPAIAKVEDALKALLEGYGPLVGTTIITEQSSDVAVEDAAIPAILIYTVAYRIDQSDEQHQSIHEATVEFECIDATQAIGTISRANHTTVAHVLGCIAADRTLGGMVQDIQEVDVAPAQPRGKDIGSASLQASITFFTSRDDWFVIKGVNGADF